MKTKLLVSLALGCALTIGCSKAGNNSQTANKAAAPAAGNAATPAIANNAQAATAEPAAGTPQIELIANGFSSGVTGVHHSNMITFEQPQAEVVSQVTAILGQPTATGRNTDCPSGASDFVRYGALTMNFEEGRFAGWVLDGTQPALSSYHGLAVGVRRSALIDELAAEVDANSTLGTEVDVNGIGALLSGSGPDATVTTLFSGVTCFAR